LTLRQAGNQGTLQTNEARSISSRASFFFVPANGSLRRFGVEEEATGIQDSAAARLTKEETMLWNAARSPAP